MFCYCGRIAEINGRCKRHLGKEPIKKVKIGKYSGYSKAFSDNKGSEKAEVDND